MLRRATKVLAIGASLALAASLAACGSDDGGGATGSEGSTHLKVATFPGVFDSMIENMAAAQGFDFFDKNSLDVELVNITGAPALAGALTGGSVQIAPIPTSTTFQLAQKGSDVRFLMSAFDLNFDIIAQKGLVDSGASSEDQLKSLAGKKIGVASVGGGNWVWIRTILARAGVDPDDATYIAIGGNATGVEAFNQKRVDAMVAYPPILQLIDQSTYEFVAPDATRLGGEAYQGYVNGAWTTTESFLKDNEKTVGEFCQAIKDTQAYALDPANEDQVVKFVASFMGVEESEAADVWSTYKNQFDPQLPESRWDVGKDLLEDQLGDFYPDYATYVYQGCAA